MCYDYIQRKCRISGDQSNDFIAKSNQNFQLVPDSEFSLKLSSACARQASIDRYADRLRIVCWTRWQDGPWKVWELEDLNSSLLLTSLESANIDQWFFVISMYFALKFAKLFAHTVNRWESSLIILCKYMIHHSAMHSYFWLEINSCETSLKIRSKTWWFIKDFAGFG